MGLGLPAPDVDDAQLFGVPVGIGSGAGEDTVSGEQLLDVASDLQVTA